MKKLKGIVLAVILLLASIMMPFDVYADTITNSNVNINYYLESVTEVSTGSYLQTYKVDFVFDQSYLGWISTKMVGTYITNNTLPATTSQFTITKSLYVNGDIASTTISFTTPNTINNGALQSLSQSIQNSNVTALADLSTLDDILNVLIDIQNTLNIDVMDDLDQILVNVGLASDYLETVTKMRQWHIPMESFAFVSYFLINGYEPVEFVQDNYIDYPVFKVNIGDIILEFVSNTGESYSKCRLTFLVSRGFSTSSLRNSLILDDGSIIDNHVWNYFYDGSSAWTGINVDIGNFTKSSSPNKITWGARSDLYFVPIYFGYTTGEYLDVSTEFALRYQMENKLLYELGLIANGTTQSSSAASDLETSNEQMADDMDDLATIESGYNQQFNNQLQQIDFTSPLENNSGILPAANFVITIFNGLINNNPFSVLIIVVCILLIGKKVIGK